MIETILINAGISENHIQKLKQELLKSKDFYSDTYTESLSPPSGNRLIPVEKIKGIGTSRGKSNVSWFDNLMNFEDCSYNYRLSTIHMFLDKIQTIPLQELIDTFQKKEYSGDGMAFYYYKEADEYYTIGGGSHRTLFAKILGAPYILAEKVYEYEKDEIKSTNYQIVDEYKKQLQSLVQELNFETKEKRMPLYRQLDIYYENIFVYSIKLPFLLDYSDSEKVKSTVNSYEKGIIQLQKLLAKDRLYSKYPQPIRRFLLIFSQRNVFGPEQKLIRLYEIGWKRT